MGQTRNTPSGGSSLLGLFKSKAKHPPAEEAAVSADRMQQPPVPTATCAHRTRSMRSGPDRYFRIPILRELSDGRFVRIGQTYMHYHGPFPVRRIELRAGQPPRCLLAYREEEWREMAVINARDLARYRQVVVDVEEFEAAWQRYNRGIRVLPSQLFAPPDWALAYRPDDDPMPETPPSPPTHTQQQKQRHPQRRDTRSSPPRAPPRLPRQLQAQTDTGEVDIHTQGPSAMQQWLQRDKELRQRLGQCAA